MLRVCLRSSPKSQEKGRREEEQVKPEGLSSSSAEIAVAEVAALAANSKRRWARLRLPPTRTNQSKRLLKTVSKQINMEEYLDDDDFLFEQNGGGGAAAEADDVVGPSGAGASGSMGLSGLEDVFEDEAGVADVVENEDVALLKRLVLNERGESQAKRAPLRTRS